MITKSLVALSIVLNLIGFNLSASKTDTKIANSLTSEDLQSVHAGNNLVVPPLSSLPKINESAPKVSINSKNFSLVDGETGVELAGKNQFTEVPIASTTKIMTAIVALENYQLNDVVTVPQAATTQTPTVVFLRTGEEISVSELLHCLLIKSGNDSAYTLASFMDKTGQGTAPFVAKMNEKAAELAMQNTHYFDPAGLSDDGHSTAHDLAIITRYALLNPTFRQIVSTQKYVAANTTKTIFHTLENSNRLITTYQYPGAIGVKTGFTYAASHCLVAAAERNGHTLVAVVLGTYADTPNASADEARKLLDFGFANVAWAS